MKVVLVVIDSFGIGEMPDADKFGDVGSNTYLNTLHKTNVKLNNLISLGLNNIDGINLSTDQTIGSYARLKELTFAKDTTAGHYEMSGIIMEHPYPTFPNGFPIANTILAELSLDLLPQTKMANSIELNIEKIMH